MDSSVKKATDDDRCVAQIISICLGTRCPPRDPSLLVSCSPVPHHVIPEGPLEEHNRNLWMGITGTDDVNKEKPFILKSPVFIGIPGEKMKGYILLYNFL